MSICKLHCVNNCVLCAGQAQPQTVQPENVPPPPSPQSEQPPTDPEAATVSRAAQDYSAACQRVSEFEKEVERTKNMFSTATQQYAKAVEEKRAAKKKLAEVVKEDE